MKKTSFRPKNPYLLWIVSILTIINMGGFTYLYQQQQLQYQKIDTFYPTFKNEFDLTLQSLHKEQENLQQNLNDLRKKMEKPHASKTTLLQLKWLVQQAKWQVNFLYQPQNALQLLELAKKISEKKQWENLTDSLNHDINQIKHISLTSPQLLLEELKALKENLLSIKLNLNKLYTTPKPTKLPYFLETLKPFVQIEKIHQVQPKIIPPSEQEIILQNILLLLPQIQYAAISHNQELYNILLKELQEEWQLIEKKFSLPIMNEILAKLQTEAFVLEKPIEFESITSIQSLQKQLNQRIKQ